MPRESLGLTDWYRDASPSNALRRQWRQGEINDAVFAHRYCWEIADAKGCLAPLTCWCRQGRLTLLSAARVLEHSHLPLLREAILAALSEEERQATGAGSRLPEAFENRRHPLPHADTHGRQAQRGILLPHDIEQRGADTRP